MTRDDDPEIWKRVLALAEKGITEIFGIQRATLAELPPPRPS